jgi:hypothetical protein
MSQTRSFPQAAATLVCATLLLSLSAACSKGGGGSFDGVEGQEFAKPSGGSYFLDTNQGGSATRLHLEQMFWGRLVDVHDVDERGNLDRTPVFTDFVINEAIQSDGNRYRLEINPITQRTRLVILRTRGAPDRGVGTFESLLRTAADNLSPVIPNGDQEVDTTFSFIARNAALVLKFDDLLKDDLEAQGDLHETVRVFQGYPPETPFLCRPIFDSNHGGVVDGEFHSTRVVLDLTISVNEASSMVIPQPINAVGLSGSETSTPSANVVVRLPTRTDFGSGQFKLLRGLSGAAVSDRDNGPIDISSATRSVVRAMRSGNATDSNNGYLLDLSPPSVVGGWFLSLDRVLDLSGGEAGFDFVVDLTFLTVCNRTPVVGDVITIGNAFLEVAREGTPPDGLGRVQGVEVRSLSQDPVTNPSSLLGAGQFLTLYQVAGQVPAGCWVTFNPPPVNFPAEGVSTSSQALVRFSEPMELGSLSPFDNFTIVRGDSSSEISATNLIVGEILPSGDQRTFTFRPTLSLPHDTNTAETYHVRVQGPTDLAGNGLALPLPAVNFEMNATEPQVRTGSTVIRFASIDEVQPIGLTDWRGQFFFDFAGQAIRPRPVAVTSYVADRVNPVPSIMIPFPPGVQTPLTPLGSKLQTLWRYCDLAWQVLDESKYNLDVIGLSWAPVGGRVINDFFDQFEIRLAHSRRMPDEAIDANLLPQYGGSGLVGGPQQFTANILIDPLSPQKVVHPRNRGYRINSADLFVADSGTVMLPWPLNRGSFEPETYTWRDTAVLALGAPGAVGIPLDIEAGPPLSLEDFFGYVAPAGAVPSFGLPLLMEYRCFPSTIGLGLNPLDISIAINSSAIPSFRSFSSGGLDESGVAIRRDPDAESVPQGGFNPTSNPPGQPTARSDDNAFYIGQLDVVTRVSRVHSVWIDTSFDAPDFGAPVVLPPRSEFPDGTDVILEFRGAHGFVLGSLDSLLGPTDESVFPFDARHLNPYGDIFAVLPIPRGTGQNQVIVDTYKLLGSDAFPGEVQYQGDIDTWSDDLDSIDGAQYFQMRVTFLSNIGTGLSPELSAIGIPYRQ